MDGDDANAHDENVKRTRRTHGQAATTHERAARAERELAETSDLFGDAEVAEEQREAARRHEAAADQERDSANRER